MSEADLILMLNARISGLLGRLAAIEEIAQKNGSTTSYDWNRVAYLADDSHPVETLGKTSRGVLERDSGASRGDAGKSRK